MPDYTFWHNVEESWKSSFTADNMEHAQQLLEAVENGDMDLADLPNYFEKNKGLDLTIDTDSLEEWN
jgi:response regulator of citrate/malate metabolism